MPKSGYVISEKESQLVIRTIDVVQKRLEKLKGRFQGAGEKKSAVSSRPSRPRSKKDRASAA